MSTQEWGAGHDGFGVLVSATFPLFQNHKFAHALPNPSWVYIKRHVIKGGLKGGVRKLLLAQVWIHATLFLMVPYLWFPPPVRALKQSTVI